MAKKKSKNSDYRYSQNRDNERYELEKKAQRDKAKRRSSWLHFTGIFLLLIAFGIGIVGTAGDGGEYMAPLCSFVTGVGMLVLSGYYMPIRKTAGKICVVLGCIMLFLTFVMLRGMGVFG